MPRGRREEPRLHPGIRIDKIPADRPMGLVFTLAALAIFLIGLPEVRWFFVFSAPLGLLVAGILRLLWRE